MPEIKSEILFWARETSGLTAEEAAKKLQLKDSKTATGVEKLLAYENGKQPSRALLIKMSKQYRKPLLAFYMDKPPIKGDRGEDYRTLPEGIEPKDDALVDALIRDIKARQSFLRETMIEEDEGENLPFIGSATLDHGISNVADAIVKTLDFDLGEFRGFKKTDDAFKYLRSAAEHLGIYVILAGNLGSHHSNIDTKIFRGFVLSDEIAPFIVINDQDAKSAWCFTLLHEIVHLWLGQTGVSGAFAESNVEQFCNDVASEVLLPSKELSGFVPDTTSFESLAQEISAFASERNISSGLVSYRLLRQGYIEKSQWFELSDHFKNQWLAHKARQRAKSKQQEGGPSYFVVRRSKLGNALVSFAERMLNAGAISTTKAGLLLGVKPLKVHKLFDSSGAI